MASLRVISADSHMMEPPDLWTERLVMKYGDRTPQVKLTSKGHLFVAPGVRPFAVAGGFGAGRSGTELKEHLKHGYESARPGGWDPVERIKDQDIDGVEAEVLYTTLGMPLFGLDDAQMQRDCFAVYNDWVAEFCSHNPRRLHAIALISLEDIGEGVKELTRCANRGLKGAMIWGSAPIDRPYYSEVYDPFWAAAQDLQMPLSLHVITAKDQAPGPKPAPAQRTPGHMVTMRGYMGLIHEVQRSMTDIVAGGVLERFPRLQIVSAENDTGWLPHYMYRMDHAFEKFGALNDDQPLKMKPSDYVRRQMWATFQDDPTGPAGYRSFGENNYMWASDFPHTDSTWPHSREVITKDFSGVPENVTSKIVFDNANRLYRMGL
jgi:predicted TIM-barrel fold metal-dependent hydrolase